MITFVETSLFVVHPMIASASSIYDNDSFGPAKMAINGILDGSDYDDMFNSGNDNYPWLAIDLGFYYKVFSTSVICKISQHSKASCVRSQGCQWWNGVDAVLTELQISMSELVLTVHLQRELVEMLRSLKMNCVEFFLDRDNWEQPQI